MVWQMAIDIALPGFNCLLIDNFFYQFLCEAKNEETLSTRSLSSNIFLTFNTYITLIRMRSKRFTSIVLQYDLEI